MADPSLYTYPSPLEGYQNLEPLPEYGRPHQPTSNVLIVNREKAADGKSFVNPPAERKSEAYSSFVSPITNGKRGGFEYGCKLHGYGNFELTTISVHIYFLQTEPEELKFATELWERMRRECTDYSSPVFSYKEY